jgi:pimeloyl-ACP methyl ester carboxylesterase/nucleotide-binding universal stress UspA family protein
MVIATQPQEIQVAEPARDGDGQPPDRHESLTEPPSLAWQSRAGRGLAILHPLSYGITNAGLVAAPGQTAFLDALASGFNLITFDQRGSGSSAGAGASTDWEEMGADLWRVADAAGVERAVLYGVADTGYTIAHAAALRPERVLGLVFNFVPPKFVADEPSAAGLPRELMSRWFEPAGTDEGAADDPWQLLDAFGVDEGDARALAERWSATSSPPAVSRRRDLISRADVRALLPTLDHPALVMQPKHRAIFRGWGDAMAALLPQARVVYPSRGIEAIGAIHAFLAVLTSDIGRQASRLSPELSATVESSEQSVGALQRIVVAVDDDVASGRAVELACRLGEAQKAAIILVHVVEVPYRLPLDQPPEEAVRRAERALELGRAIVERHRSASCTSRLVTGRVIATSIVRAAAEESADLIVVSDSESGERRNGSSPVVAEVLRRAPGKVLVNSGRRA